METAKDAGRRISLSGMLKKLGVSRSGYQAFLKRGPSVSQIRKERVKQRILELYNDSNQNYGAPKIARLLQKEGERISERTVGLYMRELKIRAQWTKPWIATTTGSDFSVEFRNILDMQFNPDHPNAVWCTDITYIWTHEGFAYLTSVMDLYSRKIIAWKFIQQHGNKPCSGCNQTSEIKAPNRPTPYSSFGPRYAVCF